MNFIFFINNKKKCSESIVQSTSFLDELSIRNPMSKNRSGDECLFKKVESIIIEEVEILQNVHPDEACQWNNNVQIVKDEPTIKISKT